MLKPADALTTAQYKYYLLGLICLSGVLFFFRLGVPGLMDPDEGRYAEIAREMLVSGDWLTPHLNQVKYLEKPPLVYWLTAISMALLGPTETAARLIPALSALGGVLSTYGLGRVMLGPREAFIAASIQATCMGYVIMGRLLTLDMTLTFLLCLGLGLGYLGITRHRRNYLRGAYLALALGVLTKGPVALVLPGLILSIWAIANRSPRVLLQLWDGPGAAIFIAVVVPWFVLVSMRNPEFLQYFLVQEHLQRFLSSQVHHGEPFYYFIGVLAMGLLPWTFFLPWGIFRIWREPGVGNLRGDRLFLLLWAGVVLLFFTLSQSKLAPYILPALPPLALIIGQVFKTPAPDQSDLNNCSGLQWTMAIWFIFALALLLIFFLFPSILGRGISRIDYLAPYPALLLAIFTAIPVLIFLLRIWHLPVWLLVLAPAMALNLLILPLTERIALQRSPRHLAQLINSQWQPGDALIGFQFYSQGLSFYTGQDFYIYNLRTELEFGRRHSPLTHLFLDTPPELAQLVQQYRRTYLIVNQDLLDKVRAILPGSCHILGQWKNYLLCSFFN